MSYAGAVSDDKFKRLQTAKQLHKYGALESWDELFRYQTFCNDLLQIKEIGEWARRFNKDKEAVTLPLKDYGKPTTLV